MQISLSAGGGPKTTMTALRSQASTQLGTNAAPADAAVVDAVLAHVESHVAGVPDGQMVSVSVSCYIGITQYTPAVTGEVQTI